MLISLKLTTPIKQIEAMMLKAIADEMNKHLVTIAEIVKAKMVFFMLEKIKSTAEYESLINGKLKAEFGLDDAQARVDTIIRKWATSLTYTVKKVSPKVRTITGGFSVNAILSDFSDVIKLADSTIFSKGGEVPWLRWLLLEGYKNLIADYDIRFGAYPKSRTGEAQMYRKPGNAYKVPNEFAGTIDDNWITKTFDNVDAELQKILLNAVDKVI